MPILTAILLGCSTFEMHAQQQNLPLNKQFFIPQEVIINQSDVVLHSSMQPLLQSKLKAVPLQKNYSADTSYFLSSIKKNRRPERSLLARKFLYEHLFVVDTNDFYLSLDPIFNFELGMDQAADTDEMLYKNMRGFMLRADLGKKVSFYSDFRENQAKFPDYVSQKVDRTSVALGQGRVKNLDDGSYDFAMASAYVSYSPSEYVNLQIGHSKHFIGNGYRSHFLSDEAFNYPYFRSATELFNSRLQYNNLYTSFQDLNRLDFKDREGMFERKMGNFIYLDYALSKDVYLGLFEGRIWPTIDSTGPLNLNPMAFNPLILVNSLIYGGDNASSGMMGLNFRWDVINSAQLYAQFALGLNEDKRSSFQIGTKLYPFKNFFVQAEYNSKSTDLSNLERASFKHYSENINFANSQLNNEIFLRTTYIYKRIIADLKLNIMDYNEMNAFFTDICAAYVLNPSTNLSVNIGAQFRNELKGNNAESQIFYLAIRTNLQNVYYNF